MKTNNNAYGEITETNELRFVRLLPAPIELVWTYLTDADKRAKWFASGPMELRPGGKMELHFDNESLSPGVPRPADHECAGAKMNFTQEVLQCQPPRLLVFSFAGGTVMFELATRGEATQLTLTHAGLTDPKLILSVSAGWHAHLGFLVARLEGTQPAPFWTTHARLQGEYEERMGMARAEV